METKKLSKESESGALEGSRDLLGKIPATAAKYSFTAFMVLLIIWLIGRIMEAAYGKAVFDGILIHWLGISTWILMGVWITGSVISYAKDISRSERRGRKIISWIFLLILAAAVLYDLDGFQVSLSGLFAVVAGSIKSSQHEFFLLYNNHPANPMLVVNLIVSKLWGGIDLGAFASYMWNWHVLFAIFAWSLAYGILLLMHQNDVWPKTIHLIFAGFGLAALFLLKSKYSPTTLQMISIHAGAVTLIVFQMLLIYSTLRSFAGPVKEPQKEPDPFSIAPKQEVQSQVKQPLGLPPSAIKIALFIFIVLPILADLHHQFNTGAL